MARQDDLVDIAGAAQRDRHPLAQRQARVGIHDHGELAAERQRLDQRIGLVAEAAPDDDGLQRHRQHAAAIRIRQRAGDEAIEHFFGHRDAVRSVSMKRGQGVEQGPIPAVTSVVGGLGRRIRIDRLDAAGQPFGRLLHR